MTMPLDPPADPIAAVTHPDPYPYYDRLVREQSFYFDECLRLWVAADAAAVETALDSDLCRVRPIAVPVPKHIEATAAGAIFGRLVRQTDGADRNALKQVLRQALSAMAPAAVARATRESFRQLRGMPLDELLFALPVQAMARLLGLESDLDDTARQTTALVQSLLPQADATAVAQGGAAAEALLAKLRATKDGGLMQHLRNDEVLLANALGLLVQTHDATAALLGNAIVMLARDPEIQKQLAAAPQVMPDFIQEVLRFDAPVQNTRRFVAADGMLCGRPVRTGEAVLVLLAAANRDPAANAEPHRFLVARDNRRLLGFGHGAHHCAGPDIAASIAATALAEMIASGPIPVMDVTAVRYHPSSNARIPDFAHT